MTVQHNRGSAELRTANSGWRDRANPRQGLDIRSSKSMNPLFTNRPQGQRQERYGSRDSFQNMMRAKFNGRGRDADQASPDRVNDRRQTAPPPPALFRDRNADRADPDQSDHRRQATAPPPSVLFRDRNADQADPEQADPEQADPEQADHRRQTAAPPSVSLRDRNSDQADPDQADHSSPPPSNLTPRGDDLVHPLSPDLFQPNNGNGGNGGDGGDGGDGGGGPPPYGNGGGGPPPYGNGGGGPPPYGMFGPNGMNPANMMPNAGEPDLSGASADFERSQRVKMFYEGMHSVVKNNDNTIVNANLSNAKGINF